VKPVTAGFWEIKMDDSRLFHGPAQWLDLITAERDWETEVAHILSLFPSKASVLEYGCRTAKLGEMLVNSGMNWRGYEPNEDYFSEARNRLPNHVSSDTIKPLSQVCMFSWFSPLYSFSPSDIEFEIERLFDFLDSGGKCILEGGCKPEHVRSRYSMMDEYQGEDLKLTRMCVPVLEGNEIIFDYHWMIGRRNYPIKHMKDRQRYWVHPDSVVIEMFTKLGGECELIESRGLRLFVITKP
jgi:hypothetical protein